MSLRTVVSACIALPVLTLSLAGCGNDLQSNAVEGCQASGTDEEVCTCMAERIDEELEGGDGQRLLAVMAADGGALSVADAAEAAGLAAAELEATRDSVESTLDRLRRSCIRL